MDIRNISAIKHETDRALTRGRDPKKVALSYAGITVLLALVLTVINYYLGSRIDNTGGLSNIGIRSILSTAQAVLPMIQTVVLLCLEFGYLHATMRIARGQYADHTDLKVGFQRFFPLLRMTLLQSFLYFGIGMATFYLAMQIYMFTPWADKLITLLLPFASSTTVLDPTMVLDEATAAQAAPYIIPMLVIYLIVYLAVLIPVGYRLRMASYALLDNPQAGAFAAIRGSMKMMRGNCLNLFKIDLQLWWYYALTLLASVVSYGDALLALMGVQLPLNATVSYYLFYLLYLAILFAIYYFLRNRVEVMYVMAYDAIHEKPKDSGVVLGNIFDM